jgi:hypothetical protein
MGGQCMFARSFEANGLLMRSRLQKGGRQGEEGPVSIGGSTQPWRQQMVLSEMSSDDEPAAPPPSRTKTPPSAIPVGAETRERRQAWETVAAVPEDA